LGHDVKSTKGKMSKMKIIGIAGILLFLLGGLVLLIGLVVCINTWKSDYATSTCEQAEKDRTKFAEAKEMCAGSNSSDCYRQATIGLVSESECESKKEFMNKQMLMGIVPAVIGLVMGIIGLIMGVAGFILGRRKRAVVAS
jgi:hypothetical protein